MGTKGRSPPTWPSSALARRLTDTHTMALTPRQYRSHMLRKRGWPPMSQSCDGDKKEVASPAALPTCPKPAPAPPRPPAPALRPKREAPGLIKTEEIPTGSWRVTNLGATSLRPCGEHPWLKLGVSSPCPPPREPRGCIWQQKPGPQPPPPAAWAPGGPRMGRGLPSLYSGGPRPQLQALTPPQQGDHVCGSLPASQK